MAKDEDRVHIEAPTLLDRDEFNGFALYPWSSTDAKPACIVLDEEQAHEIARLFEGGAEVRRCIVRLQDHARDELGDLIGLAESAQNEIDTLTERLDEAERDEETAKDERDEEREKANVMRRVLTDFQQTITAMRSQIDVLDLTEK